MHVRNQVTAPAVVHQIENNLVQHLLKQRCANPQVLDSLRGEAGQPGHPAKTVLALEALTAPASGGKKKTTPCKLIACVNHESVCKQKGTKGPFK